MLIHNGYVYYTMGEPSGSDSPLYRSKLDGTNEKMLFEDISHNDFCIYNNTLYCKYFDDVGNALSISMNLDTMKIKEESFFFYDGDPNCWLVSDEFGKKPNYYCTPGYEHVKRWTGEYQPWKVRGDKYYDLRESTIVEANIGNHQLNEIYVGPDIIPNKSDLLGNGMYYMLKEKTNILFRKDIVTGDITSYNLSEYFTYESGICLITEIHETLYFKQYINSYDAEGNNTYGYALDLKSGRIDFFGSWFET